MSAPPNRLRLRKLFRKSAFAPLDNFTLLVIISNSVSWSPPVERFQRHTQQRKAILEELQKVSSHPTAVGLYEIVRRRLPKISLGTVYRNLELLTQAGLVQKLESGGEARFDGNVEQHDHLRCVSCGRVDDLHCPPLDLWGAGGNDWGGYKITGHRLEFLGVCPRCQNRQRSEPGGQPDKTATAEL